MFGGGYRVSVPLMGSILQRVAGIDLYTFSAFLMVGVPVLTGLALGAFSWRTHKDPLLFLLIMLSTGALFMTTPYVGYLDNITVLYFLSLILAFFAPARTSWGARTAMFLIGIAAAFTHPTTCVIFGFSLMAVFGLRLLTSRFHLGPPLKELGPSLMSVGFGMIFGLSTWLIAPWGVTGSLADAALPPPYTKEVFFSRLSGWVGSLQPGILVPLVLLAIGWTIWSARRDRARSDEFGTISAMLLLPFLGIFGFVAATYPYYRFMNATMALFALGGLGAYVAIRWLWKREGAAKIVGVVASLLIVASFGYIWMQGREISHWADPDSQWIDQPTRTALEAARAVVENEPGDRPIVFVVNYDDTYQSYGWSKTFTNVSRTGLPGDAVKRSMTYFGSVEDFLADQPTVLTPYANVDMSALVHQGLTRNLAAAYQTGAAVADSVLPRTFGRNVAWPPGGTADLSLLTNLAAIEHVGTVVLNSSQMPPVNADAVFRPDDAVASLRVAGLPMNVLLSDNTLTGVLRAGNTSSGTLAKSTEFAVRQRFLAETAMIAAEAPDSRRTIVVAPPGGWSPSEALASDLLGETATTPWLTATPLTSLSSAAHTERAVPRHSPSDSEASPGELSRGYLSAVRDVGDRLGVYQSMLYRPAAAYTRSLNEALLATQSAAWRGASRLARASERQISEQDVGSNFPVCAETSQVPPSGLNTT
jgi:hypothetical protein